VIYRVASDKTRSLAIRTIQRQNKQLYDYMERLGKDEEQLKARLQAEYHSNIRRIEDIERLDLGAAAIHERDRRDQSGPTGAGSPRMAEQQGEGEDWRVRVAGVLEDRAAAFDPSGQYGLSEPGEFGGIGG
jgi:hypothetical protein